MPVRNAKAQWMGDLTAGRGTLKLGSGSYEGAYNFSSRFENGTGTNPEELIAAAHAGCYSMALSAELGKAGFKPTNISTQAKVSIDRDSSGFSITKITLDCEAQVPGIDKKKFQEIAEATKNGCPVSKALKSVP